MGSLPASSLARQGARVVHVFVATYVNVRCAAGRLRRGEPPPSRNYFRGLMWLSTSAATGLSAAVPCGLPQSRSRCDFHARLRRGQSFLRSFRATLGTPASARVARDAPVIDACCAGTAAVRTALPARSRAALFSLAFRLGVTRLILAAGALTMYSAGRRAVRLRLLTRAIVRYRRVGRTR
jgi:hypothetical protein